MSLWTEHPLPWKTSIDPCFASGEGMIEVHSAKGRLVMRSVWLDHAEWREIIDRLNAGEKLLGAAKKSLSFVGHAAEAQDWCGCEDCRLEWEEILEELQPAIVAYE